ncbi:MAG: tRNA 4-thiouridine(8) synthase ThiI [Firmicutes bacterium]|nr:tRNA 4-thiouridine(8) synthase ThiI [Bacillota bacterium]
MTRAVSLISGGLDSQLAVKVIQDQGIEVHGVNFVSPFFGGSDSVVQAARQLGIGLHTIDFSEEYLALLKNPRYGFGKNLNPCIDCHGFMLNLAGKYMEQIGADFIITGEVLKQRPMSQNKDALGIVERLSGYPGLILRPLSAKLLPPTEPEIRGLVDRERLLDISGRSRRAQIELTERYGITDYPSPAGGCLLTVPSFAERLRHLFIRRPEPSRRELERLKVGRHFFGPGGFYLITGRRHDENEVLQSSLQPGEVLLKAAAHPGPVSLLSKTDGSPITPGDLSIAASLTARYSDGRELDSVEIKHWSLESEPEVMPAAPRDPSGIAGLEHY